MKTRFLSWKFSWHRVGTGILTGAVILLVLALAFVVLTESGWLTRQV